MAKQTEAKILQADSHYFLLSDVVEEKNPEVLQRFFNPNYWQKKNLVLGKAQGRGTTYFLNTQILWGFNTALRHYYRGGLYGKFNRQFYWCKNLDECRSFAEFRLLEKMYLANLPVPKPILAHVKRLSYNFYTADLISQCLENAQDLTQFLQKQNLEYKPWQQIGELIQKFHQQQICHTDLNAHNILLKLDENNNYQFYVIDFDKCFEKTGDSWKVENLNRLLRSFNKEKQRLKINFDQTCWQALLTGYNSN